MNRKEKINTLEEVKKELEDLKELQRSDPTAAKIVAKVALIKTSVLNEDKNSKEHVFTESHIDFDETNMSYEDIVDTMKNCLISLRELGGGNLVETRAIIRKTLIDSGYIDNHGHIIAREKRSPQVEEFFKRLEAEMRVSQEQRIRK